MLKSSTFGTTYMSGPFTSYLYTGSQLLRFS